MRRRIAVLVVAAVLLGLLAGSAILPSGAAARSGACLIGVPGPRCAVWTGRVVAVGDGDTLDVAVAGDVVPWRRVRIAGLQAMELSDYAARHRVGDCHGVEAAVRLEQLVRAGRGRVRLAARYPESRSRRRLLRSVAVRVGGRWRDVGTQLLSEGLGLWWPLWSESAPNALYGLLVQRAAAAQRGVFDPDACGIGPAATSLLSVRVNWDADGPDGANPAGEWVQVLNGDPVAPVALDGWHLRDAGLRRFAFPPGSSIPPGGRITVLVGAGGDGIATFGWGLRTAIFSNATFDARAMGDGAYLLDPLGNVRAATVYPCRLDCRDARQGALDLDVRPADGERIRVANTSSASVSLDGLLVRAHGAAYHFGADAVLAPGDTLELRPRAEPSGDTPLRRGWGRSTAVLDDEDGVLRLVTDTDVSVACAAWGDRSC